MSSNANTSIGSNTTMNSVSLGSVASSLGRESTGRLIYKRNTTTGRVYHRFSKTAKYDKKLLRRQHRLIKEIHQWTATMPDCEERSESCKSILEFVELLECQNLMMEELLERKNKVMDMLSGLHLRERQFMVSSQKLKASHSKLVDMSCLEKDYKSKKEAQELLEVTTLKNCEFYNKCLSIDVRNSLAEYSISVERWSEEIKSVAQTFQKRYVERANEELKSKYQEAKDFYERHPNHILKSRVVNQHMQSASILSTSDASDEAPMDEESLCGSVKNKVTLGINSLRQRMRVGGVLSRAVSQQRDVSSKPPNSKPPVLPHSNSTLQPPPLFNQPSALNIPKGKNTLENQYSGTGFNGYLPQHPYYPRAPINTLREPASKPVSRRTQAEPLDDSDPLAQVLQHNGFSTSASPEGGLLSLNGMAALGSELWN